MSTAGKIRGFVEAVYSKTHEGSIEWSVSDDKSTVRASLGQYHVALSEIPSSSFEQDIKCWIFDSDWQEIDSFMDEDLARFTPTVAGQKTYYGVLSSIIETAKRQASGADRALDNLLTIVGGSSIEQESVADEDLGDDLPF